MDATAGGAGDRRRDAAGSWLGRLLPADAEARAATRRRLLRLLVAGELILGLLYLSWRWLVSTDWTVWPIALPLLLAETFVFLEACLFGLTIWRLRDRREPPQPFSAATVDVFVTCFREAVE